MRVWDRTEGTPVGPDGSAVVVGHIASEAQALRWHARGYDVPAAAGRYDAFIARWEAAAGETAADDMVRAFYREEAEIVRRAGLGDDPDFWRLDAAPKHYEWA